MNGLVRDFAWRLWVVVFLLVVLAGCATVFYEPKRVRYTYQVTMTEPERSDAYVFRDDAIDIRFQFLEEKLTFHIHNNTAALMSINWDSSRYVSETGVAKPVIHQDTSFHNRDKPQLPTTIAPGGFHDDFIIPRENVLGGPIHHVILPILPVWDYPSERYVPSSAANADQMAERRRTIASSLNQRTIGLDLALRVKTKMRTYRFRFLVRVYRN